MPRTVTGQPYTCRVTVTGTRAERQGGDSRFPPAGDGPLTPEQAAQLPFDGPRATVNLEARHDAEARSAVEEFARLFEKASGVFKDALDSAQASAERYRLVRHQKAGLHAVRKDRANASPR